MTSEGYELRARIWRNCCPYSGLTTRQIEKHVEAIAASIERARTPQIRMRRRRTL